MLAYFFVEVEPKLFKVSVNFEKISKHTQEHSRAQCHHQGIYPIPAAGEEPVAQHL
jgi:hypothetical protein